jgi:UDP-GlcNAc:undecaprenyl-phosphate/decaprenyl-phosphate GlcNAc-1-phosphate transferase
MFLIGGIISSVIINRLLLRFSESLGIRNNNDVVIRWSNQSKPSLGGISFFTVFLFSTLAYAIVFSDEDIFSNLKFTGLLVAASMAFIMGLADDAYDTKPLAKLLIQVLCGITLVLTDTKIDVFHIEWLDSIFTVIWVVALMNSLNMLDNMDGITATTVLFILISCLASSFIIFEFNRNIWSVIIISQIGALIGFLKYNINPSKMFMGDAGSQFIGFFVAFFSINNLWNVGESTDNPSWIGFFICLVAFTPAVADTLTVVINRIKRGQSPMIGGKDHTTHHLVYAGLTDKKVWYVFLLISAVSTLLSVFMIYLGKIKVLIPIIIMLSFFIVVFVLLYRVTIKHKMPQGKHKM